MDASEPTTQTRAVSARAIVILLASVSALWVLIVLVSMALERQRVGPLLAATVAWLIAFGLMARFTHRLGRRERRLAEGLTLARERDGLVCPHCLCRPALDAEAPPCCRDAAVGWDATHYRLWWEAARNGEIGGGGWGWPGDETRNSGWRRWRPGVMTLFWGGLAIAGLGGGTASTDAFSLVLLVLPRLLIGYGLDLVGRGAILGPPGHRLCAACGYPRIGGSVATRCPECGAAWERAGGTLTLRPGLDRRVVAIGGAVTVLGLVAMLGQLSPTMQSFVRRSQSTAGLIRVAAADGPASSRASGIAWSELATRTLAPAEEAALFDALLDARVDAAFMSLPAKAWVQGYLASGKATAAQLHRWRAESFSPRLEGPRVATVGSPITLSIRGHHHEELLPPATGVAVHIGAVGFDGVPPEKPTGGRGYWSLEIHQGVLKPEVTVTPPRSGPQTLRVRLWLIARGYGSLHEPVAWRPDATPVPPRDAVWTEPVDVTWSVDVRP